MNNPFIFRVLDISTGHMTREDSERLFAESEDLTAYELGEYGWLVYVGEIDDNWPEENWSGAFRNVLQAAKGLGCDYVRFDRDGREYEGLPTFDW